MAKNAEKGVGVSSMRLMQLRIVQTVERARSRLDSTREELIERGWSWLEEEIIQWSGGRPRPRPRRDEKTWPIRGHNAPIFSPSRLACKCCFFMPFLPVLSSREEKPVEINDSEILIQWQGCRQSRGFLRFAASCPTSSRLRAVLPTFLSLASIVGGRRKKKRKKRRKRERMPGFCLSDEADSALRRISALAIEINLSRYARKFLSWRIVNDKVNMTRWKWDMGL